MKFVPAPLQRNFFPLDTIASVKVPIRLLVAPADTLTPPQTGVEAAEGNAMIVIIDIPGGTLIHTKRVSQKVHGARNRVVCAPSRSDVMALRRRMLPAQR